METQNLTTKPNIDKKNILILFLIVLNLFLISYLLLVRPSPPAQTQPTTNLPTPSQSVDPTSSWQTIVFTHYGLEIKIPSGWIISNNALTGEPLVLTGMETVIEDKTNILFIRKKDDPNQAIDFAMDQGIPNGIVRSGDSAEIDQIISTFKFTIPTSTSTWQTYKNERYGFEFKYPDKLELKEKTIQGEKGYCYCIDFTKSVSLNLSSKVWAGAAGCFFSDFGIGGNSIDFEAPRMGGFPDTLGYRKEGSKIIYRFTPEKEYEIPPELIKRVFINPNGVEVVVVEGKNSESISQFPIMGTPGNGYIGAIFNTKSQKLPGLAVVYSKTSSLLSESEFNQVLSTFKFTN